MIDLLKKVLPSSKVKKDIEFTYNEIGDIEPILINEMSLISVVKKSILNLREKNSKLKIDRSFKKMSLIIPYRHRQEHLKKFIPTIKEHLDKQNIDYEIIVVEQDDKNKFNKAKLMNIGALNSSKESQYFVFHDVDLLPEDSVDYSFCNHTLKLFNYIEEDNICKEYGQTIFGGAILIPREIFFDINGFSNNYWQWGKEDDDFLMRHLLKGKIPLYDKSGKFNALAHLPSLHRDSDGEYTSNQNTLKDNKKAYRKNKTIFSDLKRGISNQDLDGINSVVDFQIVSIEKDKNVKTIKVNI